jgi:uncharacterized membrane protein
MAEEDEARPERQQPQDHGEYDVGRLLALSDGVFAIAMTLLVLDVPIPQRIAVEADAALQAALLQAFVPLLAFALSFFLVGVAWLRHRAMLRGLARTDGGLAWINLLMLFVVCLVPFSAGVLSRYGYLSTAVVLYAANMALLGLSGLGLRWRCWRGRLLKVHPTRVEQRMAVADSVLSVAVFALSMPIAVFNPTAGEFFWTAQGLSAFRPMVRRRLLPR